MTTGTVEGFVEMKNLRTSCLVGGEQRTVINGLNDIGGGFYKLNPWYAGDLQALFQIQSLNGGRFEFRSGGRPSVIGGSAIGKL